MYASVTNNAENVELNKSSILSRTPRTNDEAKLFLCSAAPTRQRLLCHSLYTATYSFHPVVEIWVIDRLPSAFPSFAPLCATPPFLPQTPTDKLTHHYYCPDENYRPTGLASYPAFHRQWGSDTESAASAFRHTVFSFLPHHLIPLISHRFFRVYY